MSTEGATLAPTFCDFFVAYRTTLGQCFPELHRMHWPADAPIPAMTFINLDRTRKTLAELDEQSKKLIEHFGAWEGKGRTVQELGSGLADLFIGQKIAMDGLDRTTLSEVRNYFVSFLNGYHGQTTRQTAVPNLRPEVRP